MLTLIVALFVVGLCFIGFELVVPGGILGGLGVVAIFASWILTFATYGAGIGIAAVLVGLVLIVLSLVVELKILPRTAAGKKFFLQSAIGATSQRPVATEDLVGKEGEALTALAPTGVAVVEGQKYEAFSMSGFLDRGSRIQVVDHDNFRVRVKKV